MKDLFRLLKRYASPYKWYMAWSIFLNIFSAVFNIFSFTLVIPILQILFGLDTTVYEFIPWNADMPIKELIINNMYYYVTLAISVWGGSKTLLLLGLFMMLMTALKAINTTMLDSRFLVQTVPMAQAIKKTSSKISK